MNDEKNLSFHELLQIVELIKSSAQFGEFHLKTGNLELDIRRGAPPSLNGGGVNSGDASERGPTQAMPAASVAQPAAASHAAPREREAAEPAIGVSPHPAHAAHAAPPAHSLQAPPRAALPADIAANATIVRSPMVGTCYRAAEPGATPFVEVGTVVDADSTVCIIEVMKLMNSLPAGVGGTVTHVLVGDAEPVEFGQPLLVIAPHGVAP